MSAILPPNPPTNCAFCNADLPNNTRRKIYCSQSCSNKNYLKKYHGLNGKGSSSYGNVPSGTTGAIHELNVCSDLLKKGLHVYRALSPAAICDLVILVDNKLLRVEVTTGHFNATGKLMCPTKDRTKFDILAIAFYDGTIEYQPSLESILFANHDAAC